jgi:predicted DNA-binding antitoxin AbrB/MazE fold protein
MTLTVEAVYENGVLKPARPLPLQERQKVRVVIESADDDAALAAGVVPCTDPRLIEWAATDAELDYPPPPEAP